MPLRKNFRRDGLAVVEPKGPNCFVDAYTEVASLAGPRRLTFLLDATVFGTVSSA